MISRQKISATLLILLIPVLVFVWFFHDGSNDSSIPVCGGESLSITNNPVPPYYLQIDSRWEKDRIGGSNETIGNVGCTLCCVSMSLFHLGYQVTPQDLNRQLVSVDGYTERGWLKWDSLRKIFNSIQIDIPKNPSHKMIDRALIANQPVITKILLNNSIDHWVLIIGKNKHNYIVMNPLNTDKSLQKLSELSDYIQSIRVIKNSSP